MADYLHTSSWMIPGRKDVKSLGRYQGLVLFDRPQRIPRECPGGFVTEVTTPTPWRAAFLWWPVRAIELRNAGTIVEGWSWLKRVERRTHYGPRASDEIVEIRPRPSTTTRLASD